MKVISYGYWPVHVRCFSQVKTARFVLFYFYGDCSKFLSVHSTSEYHDTVCFDSFHYVMIGVALACQIKLGEMQLTLLTQLAESQLGALDALAQY